MDYPSDIPAAVIARLDRLAVPPEERLRLATTPAGALGQRTISEALAHPEGLEFVMQYLSRVEEYVGIVDNPRPHLPPSPPRGRDAEPG